MFSDTVPGTMDINMRKYPCPPAASILIGKKAVQHSLMISTQ
jgi:hypothetical protein